MLKTCQNVFKYLVEEFVSKNLELLKLKGAYPYQYMNSFERFNEEKLRARKYFYSSAEGGKISDDDKISDGHICIKVYLISEKIWDRFEMKNMGNYHDHNFKKDVLQLAAVFQKFIGTCLKYYGLGPCCYVSSPGFRCYVKNDGVKLQKITDIDKYLFIEKGLEGGISYIAKIHAKANNKYMNDYDPKKQSTFITYLDMNNFI